jgi:hypothetical protein
MSFTSASEATREKYAARMNRVVDHIHKHIEDPLDLEQLAAVANFSPFHFHRLFRASLGETLQDFVHRRRLERAAHVPLRARVLPSEYAAPWDALVGDWLPGSGYQPDHRPAMEFYLNDPATDAEGKFDLEVCLPVRPL